MAKVPGFAKALCRPLAHREMDINNVYECAVYVVNAAEFFNSLLVSHTLSGQIRVAPNCPRVAKSPHGQEHRHRRSRSSRRGLRKSSMHTFF